MAETTLRLYDMNNTMVAEVEETQAKDITFPGDIRWTWVLDARHTPYSEMEREALIHRAAHVRKLYILVAEEAAEAAAGAGGDEKTDD